MADNLDDDWWMNGDNATGLHEQNTDKDSVTECKQNEKPAKPRKRKLGKVSEIKVHQKQAGKKVQDDTKSENSSIPPGEKPAKKKKWKKMKITAVLAKQPPETLKSSELIVAIAAQFKDTLSPVELERIQLDEGHFVACNDVKHKLGSYVKMVFPKWKKFMQKMPVKLGCPLVIIVTGAASRATDLIRELSDFKAEQCKVAKLFAKHFKMAEQVKLLQTCPIHIGVGTPSRIQALVANGTLKLDETKVLILDWSWRDSKLKRLVDMPDIRPDLWMLMVKHAIPQLKTKQMKVGLF